MAAVEWNITDASFADVRFHVAVPKAGFNSGISSQDIATERRLQISEKPLIDGGDIEDFGRKPRTFTAEVVFFGADYLPDLKTFEDALNSGKSGVLILPDLEEAVYAKFARSSRKSTWQDGNSTTLSVTWMEDRTKQVLVNALRTKAEAITALASGNTAAALPTIQNKASDLQAKIEAARAALSLNSYLGYLATAEKAVVSTTSKINAALNVPKNLRQDIISTVGRVQLELSSLQAAVKGIQSFSDLLALGLGEAAPTRYNTGLGAVDVARVDEPIATVAAGTNAVVAVPVVEPAVIQSFTEGVKSLTGSANAIADGKSKLETQTKGQTATFSAAATQLLNSVFDLVGVIDQGSSVQVMTNVQSSLLEVCFRNGLSVEDIERVAKLNTNLEDLLDIPPYTVVNL